MLALTAAFGVCLTLGAAVFAAVLPSSNGPEAPLRVLARPSLPTPTSEAHAERWFNGRPLRAVGTIKMRTTAYSPDFRSCGKFADGITASGYSVWTNGTKLVAADTDVLPFGSLVSIPGYNNGEPVPVLDRGKAIKGKRLDLLYPTHREARVWGVQDHEVIVWEYADGKPSDYTSGW